MLNTILSIHVFNNYESAMSISYNVYNLWMVVYMMILEKTLKNTVDCEYSYYTNSTNDLT